MSKQTTKSLVPKLRFPEFRDAGAWEEKSIQELIDEKIIISHLDGNHGALYPRAEEFSQEGVPYISANDFITGFIDFSGCKHLPMQRALQFQKGVAKDGDILFAHNATVGPVAKLITTLQFVILSTTATYFRCDNKNLINDFLKFTLSSPSFVKQYTRVMSQSTRNQVPITTQRKFSLQVPLFAEQQKIADCLSSIDELITAHTQKHDALKAHKKGLMQQLFPVEGETVPKLRFPEFQDAGKWEERQLSQLTTKISDGIHTTPVYDENGEYAFINGNNLVNGRIVIDEKTKRVNLDEFNKHKKPLDANSILISINGTIGNLAFFRDEPLILGKSACFINIDSKLVNKLFIYNMLQTNKVKYVFTSELTGSTIKNLSLGTIKNIEFPVPTLPEQQKIADCFSSIDDLIAAQSQKIESLKDHKKGLMQQLFPAAEEVGG